MADPALAAQLRGRRILVIEDDYIIASDLAYALEDRGAQVVGPAGSVHEALALIAGDNRLDAAVLDVNLGAERSFPIVDTLLDRGVPVILTTGYDVRAIPEAYVKLPRMEKPVDKLALTRTLMSMKAHA